MSAYFKKNPKKAIEENIIKINKDFLKDYLGRLILIIFYIVRNNKLIFIFNILINSGTNGNIFINRNFINILNIKKL